ncbi:hypothetical protein QQZ08_001579 [Neonectria magnoliae]|uniref:Uncharacterized protein n=1 Tax=Neonectria magnoliae TaxID=2732573 RepID=A0ABR1IG35_9HYPO
MDGVFCKLTHRPSSSDYFLRLANLEETGNFKKCVQALQRPTTIHLQRKTTEADLSNNQTIESSQPPAAANQPDADLTPATQDQATRTSSSAIEDLASISAEAEEAGSVSATADETLIDMDNFEEVHNSQIPCLLNATEHIVHLVENVMVHYALEDHLVDSVIQGIEDGAIEYWVQHGFMRDCEDEIKENLIAVLRNMAQIKIKMHLRQSGREKKQNQPVQAEVDRCTEAIAEQVRRVQYSPEMLESLQQLAVVPDDWKATKDLPVAATAVASSGLQNVEAATKNSTVSENVVPTTPSITKASTRRRPTKGLADSRWATNGGHGGVRTMHPVSQPRSTPSMSSGNTRSTLNPSTVIRAQGLSSSRYATEPVQFEGKFTGAR